MTTTMVISNLTLIWLASCWLAGRSWCAVPYLMQQQPSGALSDFRDWMSQLLQEDDCDDDHDDNHPLLSANAAFS